MRGMKPTRQLEVARFMLATGNYSKSLARALQVASTPDNLATPRGRPVRCLPPEIKGDMQRELDYLLKNLKVADSYGTDVLSLVSAVAYISRLVNNSEVESYLRQRHPDVLEKFRAIVTAGPLNHASAGT